MVAILDVISELTTEFDSPSDLFDTIAIRFSIIHSMNSALLASISNVIIRISYVLG